jgi:type IV secretion system protein VirD4
VVEVLQRHDDDRQQLVDLNTRERPLEGRHPVPVLLLLDEFARLGHAETLAKAFAFVAGYGLRLLPVLQSPAQLRAEYGPDLAEEIIANCGAEIAFAPKELKVAQDLSERLGAYTYKARSQSTPTLFSKGNRTTSESGQRRLLKLPQELIQLPQDRLIVLRAGVPPIRGRKIAYYRERAFTRRVLPPPAVAARPVPAPTALLSAAPPSAAAPKDPFDLTLDLAMPVLAAEGVAPLPAAGASPAEVEAWVDRFIDLSANPREAPHGR